MSNSDSDEDNPHIRFGTALEPYEDDEVPTKRKYQQPADQYAVDEHGRRRFHGAFTGGFSAGFGNTVGTPEGWTPASFKSSRGEAKASFSSQRPEDFMDDEDRDQFGIAPRHLQTKSEFSGRKRNSQTRYHDGPIPGEPVLEQILRPVHETVAVKLLRAMGWRDGRGAGGEVTRAERRKARQQHKVYGCFIPEEMRETTETQADSSSDSEVDFDALYQPEDYEPYILQRKNDQFGLGYRGLSRHSVLGEMTGEYGAGQGRSHLLMKEKGKKVSIRGQAFGVGAFEEDDQDIYATEDMSHYDFELGGEKRNAKVQKKQEGGVNVLEGFVKASKPMGVVQNYPPPVLPRDYQPRAAGLRRTRFDSVAAPERDQGLGRHELTAEARGALLGETSLPKQNQTEPEDLIAKITGRNINFTTTSENEPSTSLQNIQNESTAQDFIPITDSGKELVKVFKPFKSDPKKQMRYEQYLNDNSSVLKRDGGMDNLSEWERNREMAEFEQASKLYKPLTGFIADRFTHASEPDDAINPLTAVAKSSINYGLATPEMIEAAKKGLYGVMTRKVNSWVPESLVYKRFNIPQPGITQEKKKAEKPTVSYSIFSYLESSVHDKESFAKEQTNFSGSKSLSKDHVMETIENNKTVANKIDDNAKKNDVNTNQDTGFAKRLTVAELFMRESEKDIQNKNTAVTETIEKFDKMDLYKSIFLSDTEDEAENNDDKNKTNLHTNTVNEFIDTPKNVERNTSPPRGIFANIDFDELNSWRRKAEEKNKAIDQSGNTVDGGKNEKIEDNNANIDDTNMYGPKIPEALQKRLQNTDNNASTSKDPVMEINSSSSSDSWVTESELKQAKKHKKKKSKKHKSKHKKSKHKKKTK